jgi:hypothetical protein
MHENSGSIARNHRLCEPSGAGFAFQAGVAVIGYYRIRDRRFIGGDDAIAIVVLPWPRCPAGLCHCALWFNLAAGGDKDAAVPRDGLAKQMTPARIAEAQKLAASGSRNQLPQRRRRRLRRTSEEKLKGFRGEKAAPISAETCAGQKDVQHTCSSPLDHFTTRLPAPGSSPGCPGSSL